MKVLRTIVLSAIFVGFAPSAFAQAFRGLGFLNPSDPSPYSQAYDVSGDGTTVVGESDGQAFRWKVAAPTVLEPLGFLPGGTVSFGRGVSADGSVVVGYGDTPDGTRAFRWTSITGAVSLGTITGTEQNFGEDCSADGSVVVGRAFDSANERGFRWTQATGMVQFATLPVPGKPANAFAVSADGMVGVGRSGCCDQNTSAVEAVRWPNGGLLAEGLGDLQVTPFPWSASAGVSSDGLVVVGGGTSGGAALFSAFRWSGGTMTELTPPLPTGDESCAMDASADGSVIVGAFSAGFGEGAFTPINTVPQARAFFWTEAQAMTDLQHFLVVRGLGPFLQGWNLKAAIGISDDGNIIVGYGRHNDLTEAFIVALDGTPFESDNGGVPPPPPDPPPGYWGTWTFGVREHHGFLWHPSKGPVPILPGDPRRSRRGRCALGGGCAGAADRPAVGRALQHAHRRIGLPRAAIRRPRVEPRFHVARAGQPRGVARVRHRPRGSLRRRHRRL
jgi:probable HAF family extracellular repeat protein